MGLSLDSRVHGNEKIYHEDVCQKQVDADNEWCSKIRLRAAGIISAGITAVFFTLKTTKSTDYTRPGQ